jgi:hypothetical protein
MFQPSREQARRFFIEAWRRYRAGEPLEPLQALAAELILHHPEYHALLEDAEASLEREWPPELGETNPFLHLGLHLAIAEQLSIDQPRGIRSQHQALCARLDDTHAAQHALMECLVETLWQSQRTGQAPDAAAYLSCVERKSRG